MKWEWATVKDDKLYMGLKATDYINPDGKTVKNEYNLWIGILNRDSQLQCVDWKEHYNVILKALQAQAPHGYMII